MRCRLPGYCGPLLGSSCRSDTQLLAAVAHQATTSYGNAFAARATIVIDVGMGYSRARDCWEVRSPARKRDSRPAGAIPHPPRPSRSDSPYG